MPNELIASYCTTFLKPEMWHLYRQLNGLRTVRTFVIAKTVINAQRFPFGCIEVIPTRPQISLAAHGWLKFVKREPPLIYRGEYKHLASVLERRGAQLMHVYFGHTGVHLLPFIERWEKPCVVSFHGSDVALRPASSGYTENLSRLFKAVPLVLARSESLANRLISLGCPPDRLRISRTGLPMEKFPLVERARPTDGRWRFLQACRLIPKKGVGTAIRAFAHFQREYPNSEFVIAGKGPLQPQLEKLIEALRITNVRFCGFVTQPQLLDLYARAHFLLHPSETKPDEDQEGVPNSILEAMATGLPVIATKHGGIGEAVESGRTGLLVSEGDHVELAHAMRRMVNWPNGFREIGSCARSTVQANFEQSDQIRQLESYYREAIELQRTARPRPREAGDRQSILPAGPRRRRD